MISFANSTIENLSIHRVGNKLHDEYFILSDEPFSFTDETLNTLLMQYFLNSFGKVNEVYHFHHSSSDLQLNEIYHFASSIFENQEKFHEESQKMAKYLYDVSNHPKIKSGEMYVVYFKEVGVEGEFLDAIGIFKSETKEPFIKVYPDKNGFGMSYEQEAININKLDKGCLIFKSEKESGYKVLVVDQTNRLTEAVYWKDEFLKLIARNDNYQQTQNVMGVCKNFITQKLDDEFELSKADKIDLLNRSMKYFKENDTFQMDDFSKDVLVNERGIESFISFKNNFEEEFEVKIPDTFEISDAAVKKQARVYKSVLKLDKNFHIYIHGNKDLIEKGYDDGMNMNYYKVYFKVEQ